MTRTGFLKAVQAGLLATVLCPAPLFAEPALSARDMLGRAQTQSENHVVKGEVARINRGQDRSKAEAAVPARPNSRRPLVVAALPPIAPLPPIPAPTIAGETSHANEAPPSTAELKEPEVPAPDKPLVSEATAPAATYTPASLPLEPPAVTSTVPAAQIPEQIPEETPSPPIPEASPSTAPGTDVVAAAPQAPTAQSGAASPAPSIDVKPANADQEAPKVAVPDPANIQATNTTRLASSEPSKDARPPKPQAAGDEIEIGGIRLRRNQVESIMARRDVKSMLARYSLN